MLPIDLDSGQSDVRTPTSFVKGERGEAGGFHIWQRADTIFDFVIECGRSRLFGLVACRAGIEVEAQDILFVEAGIDIVEIDQTAKKEPSSDHEDE